MINKQELKGVTIADCGRNPAFKVNRVERTDINYHHQLADELVQPHKRRRNYSKIHSVIAPKFLLRDPKYKGLIVYVFFRLY